MYNALFVAGDRLEDGLVAAIAILVSVLATIIFKVNSMVGISISPSIPWLLDVNLSWTAFMLKLPRLFLFDFAAFSLPNSFFLLSSSTYLLVTVVLLLHTSDNHGLTLGLSRFAKDAICGPLFLPTMQMFKRIWDCTYGVVTTTLDSDPTITCWEVRQMCVDWHIA